MITLQYRRVQETGQLSKSHSKGKTPIWLIQINHRIQGEGKLIATGKVDHFSQLLNEIEKHTEILIYSNT